MRTGVRGSLMSSSRPRPRARAARQADFRIHGDVVALVRPRGVPGCRVRAAASAVRAPLRRAPPQQPPPPRDRCWSDASRSSFLGATGRSLEDAGRADDGRLSPGAFSGTLITSRRNRRGVRIVDAAVLATRRPLPPNARPPFRIHRYRRCASSPSLAARRCACAIRGTSARSSPASDAGCRRCRRRGMPRTRSLLTGSGDAFEAAVLAAVRRLRRHEEQVAVYRHVVLRRRAQIGLHQDRLRRVADVVDVEAVVVALDRRGCPRTRDRSASRRASCPLAASSKHAHVPRGLFRIPASGFRDSAADRALARSPTRPARPASASRPAVAAAVAAECRDPRAAPAAIERAPRAPAALACRARLRAVRRRCGAGVARQPQSGAGAGSRGVERLSSSRTRHADAAAAIERATQAFDSVSSFSCVIPQHFVHAIDLDRLIGVHVRRKLVRSVSSCAAPYDLKSTSTMSMAP